MSITLKFYTANISTASSHWFFNVPASATRHNRETAFITDVSETCRQHQEKVKKWKLHTKKPKSFQHILYVLYDWVSSNTSILTANKVHKDQRLPSAAICCPSACPSCRSSFSSFWSFGCWWLLWWMLGLLLFWWLLLLSLSLLEFWLLTRADETPIPVPALKPTRAQP